MNASRHPKVQLNTVEAWRPACTFSQIPTGSCNYSRCGLAAVRSIGLFPDASSVIHLEFKVSGYTLEYHQEYDILSDEIIYQTTVLVLATRESSIIGAHTHTNTRAHTHTRAFLCT